MATPTQRHSRPTARLTPLSRRQAFLQASGRQLKELRMIRIMTIKDRIAEGSYDISADIVAEALIQETVIDAAAAAITRDERSSEKRARYTKITVERSNSSKHALWSVVGWTADRQRCTLAVSLRKDIAEELRQRMLRRRGLATIDSRQSS